MTCAMGSLCSHIVTSEHKSLNEETGASTSNDIYHMKAWVITELNMGHTGDMAFNTSGSDLRNFNHTVRNSEFYSKKTIEHNTWSSAWPQ